MSSTDCHVRAALQVGVVLLTMLMSPLATHAGGLQLPPVEAGSLRWQARVQLSQLNQLDGASGSRILNANLLGDYYLTGSLLGKNTQGGLRATGGLLMGSSSWSESSGGLALGANALSRRQPLAFGYRNISLLGPTLPSHYDSASSSRSYLGIGYTGQSLRGGWGFSADLGLASERDDLRLGRSAQGQSLEELLMDMKLRPVLQLGLSYSY
jgi:hypothetical protein